MVCVDVGWWCWVRINHSCANLVFSNFKIRSCVFAVKLDFSVCRLHERRTPQRTVFAAGQSTTRRGFPGQRAGALCWVSVRLLQKEPVQPPLHLCWPMESTWMQVWPHPTDSHSLVTSLQHFGTSAWKHNHGKQLHRPSITFDTKKMCSNRARSWDIWERDFM